MAVSLWRRWCCARRSTIPVAIAGVAPAVAASSSAVIELRLVALARDGWQIIVRVMVGFYLIQEPVKDCLARP